MTSPPKAVLQRPLRVLSFDGGGVRGLSSLLILRRIMYTVAPSDELYALPKPCEYFDMICGTSTGGLIAIMLGRLNMGVQECIECYSRLTQTIFQESPYSWLYPKWAGRLLGKPRFSGERLTDAVKHIVQNNAGSEEVSLRDNRENACKVFVCATRTATTEAALLRSYSSNEEDDSQTTIWQAARATSAAPTFFPSISFGNPPANYVDGALLHNNPIRLLMREASNIWGTNLQFACVLSIGTGAPPTRKLGSMGHEVLLACAKLATHSENVARSFRADQEDKLVKDKRYFRFNVTRGLQGVGLEEWKALGMIDATTKAYLEDLTSEIQACAERIRTPGMLNTTKYNMETSPQYIDVSRASSQYFTGRDDVLMLLHNYFQKADRKHPQIAVLIGLGGIGKSQISLHYAERHRADYVAAFLIDASSSQEIKSAFVRIAHIVIEEELRYNITSTYNDIANKLGFSALVNLNDSWPLVDHEQLIVEGVIRWLGRLQRKFLIIFDGMDDPANLRVNNLLFHHCDGDIIITSRDTDAKALGQSFFVEGMPQDVAVTLLSRVANQTFGNRREQETAGKIVATLGYLPLAINQAGGYLANSDLDINSFLSTYAVHAKSLLSKIPNDGILDYRRSAFTTWEMSFKRIQAHSPISASLLELLGFMYPKDICEALYKPGAGQDSAITYGQLTNDGADLFSPLHSSPQWADIEWLRTADSFSLNEAFTPLVKLCLLKRTSDNRTYNVHPVVHVWSRERLDLTKQADYAKLAVLFVARALPMLQQGDYTKAWEKHRRLLPHIKSCWTHAKAFCPLDPGTNDVVFFRTLGILAASLRAQGQQNCAEDILLHVVKGNEALIGSDHLDTLQTFESLASIYDYRGDLPKAENLYKRVLEGRMRVLGVNHRATLTALQNLADVLEYKGEVREAEEMYKRALEGRQNLGNDDSDVFETLDALASLYEHEGRIEYAETLRLRALNGRERILGSNHPDTLATAVNMGCLYWSKGEEASTREMFERAYTGRRALLGPQHPKTLVVLNNIAGFYGSIGYTQKAEVMCREALAGRESVLGHEHPDTLWTQNCLGGLLFVQGNPQAGLELVQNSVKGLEKALGAHHLDTLWVVHNLAMVYEHIGRVGEAEQMYQRSMVGYHAALGPHHIDTLWMVNDSAACCLRAGKLEQAESLFSRAYEGKLKLFGFFNPHTLYTAALHAVALYALGKEKAAESLFKETLAAMLQVLGSEHPDACICMAGLGDLYTRQRRFDEAEDVFVEVCRVREKLHGPDHPNTRNVKDKLAGLGLQREALLQGHGEPYEPPGNLSKFLPLPTTYGFRTRSRKEERRWL